MKKLVLTEPFITKLQRLKHVPKDLTYDGASLNTYGKSPIVAIVGSRKVTPYGKQVTERLSEEITAAGVVIVSGLALGIDALAHQTCIKNDGRTIAVVPRGSYPRTNSSIARSILEKNGTIISDNMAESVPIRAAFLQRNRVVAALSDAVIIPEASLKSGSLNTARNALEMGIPLFVVPGNITSPLSQGTNELLKKGAHVITEAADVLKLLNIDTKKQMALSLEGDDETQTAILKALHSGATDPAEIQLAAKLSSANFLIAISMLEVDGRVTKNNKGWVLSP